MKKLLIFFFILVLNFAVKAQYPVVQQLGSNNTLIRLGTTYGGALKGNLVQGVYADTTEANAGYIDAYPGAIIFSTGNSTMYVRNAEANGWIALATGLSAVNIYTSDGTLGGDRILAGASRSLTFTGLSEFRMEDVMSEIVIGNSATNRLRISSGFGAFLSLDADSVLMTRLPQSQLLSTDSVLIRTADYKLKTRSVGSIVGTTYYNSNIGSGYRLAVPGTNNIKTLFAGYGIIKDSTSNANAITTKLDTATVFQAVRQFSWGVNGNAGTTPGANYIGTSDAQSLYFKTKGILAGFLEHSDTIAPLWARGNNVRFLLGTHAGQNLIENNITGSNTIIGPFAGRFTRSTANTFIGFHTGLWHRNGGVNGGRNVVIGDWAMGVGVNAYDNTSAGVFSLNQCFDCVSSAAFGRDVYKSLVHGNGMTGIGAYAGLFLSTGIKAVNVTNGGSGYTTATVTISAPFFAPNGGQCSITATATATINAGVITAITVTDPGCGYLNQDYTFNELGVNFTFTKPTVTITGDGTGATATLEFISPEGNTNVGGLSGLYRRFSYYDTYLGSNAGTISRYRDSFNVYAGYGADVDATVPLTTDIARSFAAGYNAKITQSNQMVLGGTTQKRVDVYGNINLFNSGDPITIGTNTNRSWNFITNNQIRGRWDSAGPLVIGSSNVYVNSWKMIVGGGTAFFDTQNGFFFARSKSTFSGGFSPNIFEDSTATSTFRPTLQTISPLMNRGELHTYNFGKARSSYNMGALNYNYYSSGNDSNYVSISMWGTLNTLNINGQNKVGVNIANPDAFFHVYGLSSVTPAIIDGHEDVTGELVNVKQSGSKKFSFHSNGSIELAETTDPTAAATGYNRLYAQAGKLYTHNDDGRVAQVIQNLQLVFGAGSGADGDTTAFTTSAIYGSFYNDADTIVVTSMRSVLQGTSPDVTYKVWYNDSLNVEAGATALVTAGSQVTNTTTGTNVTSFDVTKIPPGVWVWVKTSTVATKPKYFSLTINGYRK